MYEQVKPITGVLLNMEEDLKREFETRIAETGTLAFRVAFAVLRNSEDAEDVAQEAFAKAYRWFWQLRDRFQYRLHRENRSERPVQCHSYDPRPLSAG